MQAFSTLLPVPRFSLNAGIFNAIACSKIQPECWHFQRYRLFQDSA
jgi:hypothetical protein